MRINGRIVRTAVCSEHYTVFIGKSCAVARRLSIPTIEQFGVIRAVEFWHKEHCIALSVLNGYGIFAVFKVFSVVAYVKSYVIFLGFPSRIKRYGSLFVHYERFAEANARSVCPTRKVVTRTSKIGIGKYDGIAVCVIQCGNGNAVGHKGYSVCRYLYFGGCRARFYDNRVIACFI